MYIVQTQFKVTNCNIPP